MKKDILAQNIKNHITDLVYRNNQPLAGNLSDYLTQKLDLDYSYISSLFSEIHQVTIEKFYICHKIERVKELLVYEKMTLKEIAYKMSYSSLPHLSSQFKKITGLTPSEFKRQCSNGELPPDDTSVI